MHLFYNKLYNYRNRLDNHFIWPNALFPINLTNNNNRKNKQKQTKKTLDLSYTKD